MRLQVIIWAGVVMVVGAVMIVKNQTMPTTQRIIMTTERQYTLPTMTAEAEAIVLGKFVSAATYTDLTTGEAVQLTDWTVTPVEAWKGQIGSTMIVTVVGGNGNGQNTKVENAPTIRRGQTALMYLRQEPSNKKWIPLSLSQGWLTLESSSKYKDGTGKTFDRVGLRAYLK